MQYNLKKSIVEELVLNQNASATLRRKNTELEVKQGEKTIVVRNAIKDWKTLLDGVAKRTTIVSEKLT